MNGLRGLLLDTKQVPLQGLPSQLPEGFSPAQGPYPSAGFSPAGA